MNFDDAALKTARDAGYSDDEIKSHLAKADPRNQQAFSAGYGLDDIAAFNKSRSAPQAQAAQAQAGQFTVMPSSPDGMKQPKPPEPGEPDITGAAGTASSFAHGLSKGAATLAGGIAAAGAAEPAIAAISAATGPAFPITHAALSMGAFIAGSWAANKSYKITEDWAATKFESVGTMQKAVEEHPQAEAMGAAIPMAAQVGQSGVRAVSKIVAGEIKDVIGGAIGGGAAGAVMPHTQAAIEKGLEYVTGGDTSSIPWPKAKDIAESVAWGAVLSQMHLGEPGSWGKGLQQEQRQFIINKMPDKVLFKIAGEPKIMEQMKASSEDIQNEFNRRMKAENMTPERAQAFVENAPTEVLQQAAGDKSFRESWGQDPAIIDKEITRRGAEQAKEIGATSTAEVLQAKADTTMVSPKEDFGIQNKPLADGEGTPAKEVTAEQPKPATDAKLEPSTPAAGDRITAAAVQGEGATHTGATHEEAAQGSQTQKAVDGEQPVNVAASRNLREADPRTGFEVTRQNGEKYFATREQATEIAKESGQLKSDLEQGAKAHSSDIDYGKGVQEPKVGAEVPTGEQGAAKAPDAKAGATDGKAEAKAGTSTGVEDPGGHAGISAGPGAAASGEFGDKRTTSLKKAVVKDERLKRGLEDLPTQERTKQEEVISQAEDNMMKDKGIGERVVSKVLDEGNASITEGEAAALLVERTRIGNERETLENEHAHPETSAARKVAIDKELQSIEEKEGRLDRAQRTAGSEWSAVGRMYQKILADDYTVEAVKRRMRRAFDRDLNEEERGQAKEIADNIKKIQDEIESQSKTDEASRQDEDVKNVHDRLVKDVEASDAKPEVEPAKATPDAPKYSKRVLEVAEKIVSRWEKSAEEAGKSLRKRLGYASSGVDPMIIADAAKVIRGWVGRQGLSFAEVSVKMAEEFGEKIKPFIKQAWDASNAMIDSERGDAAVREAARAGVRKKSEMTPEQAKMSVKADMVAGGELTHKAVYDLARAHIKAGVRGEDKIMAAVHNDIKEFFPNATERDVRRAFSEYGKAKFPSQEEDKKVLAEARTLVRLQESIDRLKEGLPALKTGVQREKSTAEIRLKEKQLGELMKKNRAPASEEQLTSNMEARKNALRNQIADLDRQIKTGEKPPGRTPPPELDAEGKKLVEERDAMKRKLQEIEDAKTPPKTEDERKVASIEKQQEKLRDIIASGKIPDKKTGNPTVDTKEVAAAKEELAKLQDQVDDIRRAQNPPKTDAEKQIDELARTKAKLDEKINSGDISTAPKSEFTPLSDTAKQLHDEVQGLRKVLDQMKKDAKPGSTPEARREAAQIKALERAIDNYSANLEAGDFGNAPSKKKLGPDTARVAALKDLLAARKSAYESAKAANQSILTPSEKYNEQRMKVLKSQLSAVQDRIASGKYGPPPRKPAPEKFDETVRLDKALKQAKLEEKKFIERDRLANRAPATKAIDAIKKTPDLWTVAKVVGHGTVGMITHAGALIFRPTVAVIYWKNFGRQFKLWANEKYHDRLIYDMEHHENYEKWKTAGLSIDVSKQYEDYDIYSGWLAPGESMRGKAASALRWSLEGGKRGFNALKLVRLELAEKAYDKLPDDIKSDPKESLAHRQIISQMMNKATGTLGEKTGWGAEIAKSKVANALMFAPRLYAARWSRILIDPLTTLHTLGKMATGNATKAEKYAAVKRITNAAELTAVLVGSLAINQGMLIASGSNQRVNLDDPSKSDWLKYKAAGKTIAFDGGILDPVRLIGQIIHASNIAPGAFGKLSQFEKSQRGGERTFSTITRYIRGKLNPFLGTVTDIYTGSDAMGRPMPQFAQLGRKPEKTKNKPQYGAVEWISQQGPIPLSESVKVVYEKMRESGLSHPEAVDIMAGAAALMGSVTGTHILEDTKAKRKRGHTIEYKE